MEAALSRRGPSRDWESVLQDWIKPASDTEDEKRKRTQAAIASAISASSIPSSKVNVFAKGSYANNTNVRLDSDVDIGVEYTGFFYFDQAGNAKGLEKSELGIFSSDDPWTPSALKDEIERALVSEFGASAVTRGNKALTVRETSRSLAADVVPCVSYRRYYGFGDHRAGNKLFPDRGAAIINWPQQQYDSGVAKNDRTGKRYKRMVRALKRLENELVEQGWCTEVVSYLIECLVYNVPNEQFGHNSLVSDMRALLATIYNATLDSGDANDWEEVNGLKWLFRGGSQAWTVQDAHQLAGESWDYMGFD
jgi:hypothetical protein